MAKKKRTSHLYTGRGGHLAVLAECLGRGWNVAIPEVDIGDDLFVVEDEEKEFYRVQVKTRTATELKKGFSAQFNVPLEQLSTPAPRELRYVFVVRHKGEWKGFVVISRDELYRLHTQEGVGRVTKSRKSVNLYISYRGDKVICSKKDFTDFVDAWEEHFFDATITEGNAGKENNWV